MTRAEIPGEELGTDEGHISLRVKIPAEDGAIVVEMTGPAVPENGPQAFGDWVLAAMQDLRPLPVDLDGPRSAAAGGQGPGTA